MPTRKLEIELIGDSSSLSKSFRGAVREADTFGSRLRHAGVMGAQVLGGALVAGAAAATYGIVKSAEAAEEANKVHAQTGAVLKSTGHAAGVSQKQVEGLAESIMRKTGIDDEAILEGQNLLLTFKDIKNEAGAGNDIFNQATKVMVDMSAAMGKDAAGSAIQLGKALNDPVKGISALQKVGVSFSDQQKEQIEQWVEEGDTLKAQKAILKELTSEFGGSAAAQATAMEKIKTSIGNVEESIGNVFLPIIDQAANKLNRDFVPELQHTADGLAKIAARKDIDLGEKLNLGGDVIKRDLGDIPGEIGDVVDAAIPIVAERSGKLGVAIAEGTIQGFLHANPIGKAAILLFASKAFGGPAAVLGAGKTFGSKFGGAAASESALAMSTFGLGAAGTKAFGLIDKAKGIGKFVGKVGLGLGIVEGATAVLSDPASGLSARLEQIDEQGKGMIGSIERDTGLSGLASAVGVDSWASQGDEAHRFQQILEQINLVHGRQHQLMLEEAHTLEDQLGLTREQRVEAGKTLRVQTIAGQDLRHGLRGLQSGKFTRLPDITAVVDKNAQAISTKFAEGSQSARDATAHNFDAAAKAIEVGMERGVITTKKGMAEIKRLTRSAHLVSGDDPWGIAKGFQRSWEASGTVTRQNINHITQDLGKMPPAAAQATGSMMLGMAREMRSKGQLSKAEMERLRSAIVTKLDLMARQGGKKGEAFQTAVATPIGGLSIDVAEALENIGVNVGDLLQKLGADNPLMGFTMSYLKSHGGGGSGKKYLDQVPELNKARGGPVRVPGQGMHDSVGLAVNNTISARVAPGEDLVVFNRHQRPMVDRALANEYGVAGLPGFFDNFDRPHWMAKGGITEPRLSGPDPLRGGAQAGIHKGYKAGKAYIKAHRPKPTTTGGVGGYSGPPANMQQLGDNAYVDSHTLAVTSALDKMFGLTMSSGFRSVQHNAEIGGAPGSLHTHGSPSNPGATDSVGPMGAMQSYIAFAKQHVAGLQEAMVDNYAGLGSNAHLGFFARGGRIGGFAGGGIVTGKVSYFGGGSTAGGKNTSEPGMALNLHPGTETGWDNPTTRGWMDASNAGHPVYGRVTIDGHTANLPITDLGPAGFTGRAIDITEGGVSKLGLSTASFPTDSIGKVAILGSGSAAAGPSKEKLEKRREHRKEQEKALHVSGHVAAEVPPLRSTPLSPTAKDLPKQIQALLRSPGLGYGGKVGISDLALGQAEETEGKDDDLAVLAFQEELFKNRKKGLQQKLKGIDSRLKTANSPAQRKKLLAQRDHVLSELGSVDSSLAGVRSTRHGLNEPDEEVEDPAVKAAEEAKAAAEEQTRAAEELAATIKSLQESIDQQNAIATSEMGVNLAEAKRALADMIEGQLGPRVVQGSLAVGIGTVGSS
jgi:hypothetical protein